MTSLCPEQQLKRRVMAWAMRIKVNPQQIVIAYMPKKWGCSDPTLSSPLY